MAAKKTGALLAARVGVRERQAIEAVARRNDRTPSREVRRAIRFYLGNLAEAERFLGRTPEVKPG